ncbi:hypothetical protein [Kitasatospora sp. GAS204B]|uniref:hypothetical protein n=1 Tax=unclassified Kitasatospora TaxID=2633591 RepID=UPI00247357F4|nr:hypothetical protein [Kitasatospora sp. GAS204B]MDH6121978.1 hypothetical protein [Kitasatospora sp. GAS204B]
MASHSTDAADARAALRAAQLAAAAARRPNPLPGWYPAASGGLFGLGFALLGVQCLLPGSRWLLVAALQLAAALALISHLLLARRVEQRPGIIPALPSGVDSRRLTAAYLAPLLLGGALAPFLGWSGFFLGLAAAGAPAHWLLLRRQRDQAGAA